MSAPGVRTWARPNRGSVLSAQNQQVKPIGSGLGSGILCGPAESLLAPEELLLGEAAHRGIGAAEGIRLGEKLGEADRVRLGDLLKGVPAESGRRERLAGVLDGGVGVDDPSGLGEP